MCCRTEVSYFFLPFPQARTGCSESLQQLTSLSLTLAPQRDEEEEEGTDFPFRRPAAQVLHDIHSVGGGLQGLLSQLFQTLLPEIEGLIQFGERLDSL